MDSIEQLITGILDLEWTMFQQIHSESPASCQNMPDKFFKIRGSLFTAWSQEALASYLSDLKIGQAEGRNFLMEKYARMDNRIPRLNDNPLIDIIVFTETIWQEDMKSRYPAIYNSICRSTNAVDDGSNFSIYLRSELETYSNRTIELYLENVKQALEKDVSLAEISLQQLIRKCGYKDLDHAESYLNLNI
ncbi:MAG: DUF4125 family protein [Pseudomonadota bacterium]